MAHSMASWMASSSQAAVDLAYTTARAQLLAERKQQESEEAKIFAVVYQTLKEVSADSKLSYDEGNRMIQKSFPGKTHLLFAIRGVHTESCSLDKATGLPSWTHMVSHAPLTLSSLRYVVNEMGADQAQTITTTCHWTQGNSRWQNFLDRVQACDHPERAACGFEHVSDSMPDAKKSDLLVVMYIWKRS
jgi:hypothetical protein